VFLPRKLFDEILHKMLETLPHLSLREDIFYRCYQPF
jgi:hypothetical protein